jgi:hypothetical protein
MTDARDRGERTLELALHRQAAALGRRGMDPETIQAELRSLELAVRAELRQVVMRNGGAA